MGQLLDFLVGAAAIAAPLNGPARAALVLGSAAFHAVAQRKKKAGTATTAGDASAEDTPTSATPPPSPAVDLLFSELRVTVDLKGGGSKEILGGVSGRARAGRCVVFGWRGRQETARRGGAGATHAPPHRPSPPPSHLISLSLSLSLTILLHTASPPSWAPPAAARQPC